PGRLPHDDRPRRAGARLRRPCDERRLQTGRHGRPVARPERVSPRSAGLFFHRRPRSYNEKAEETRELLDSIDTSTVVGLRDRAIIAAMVYSFARVGAMVTMRVEDYFVQGRRSWLRLQ